MNTRSFKQAKLVTGETSTGTAFGVSETKWEEKPHLRLGLSPVPSTALFQKKSVVRLGSLKEKVFRRCSRSNFLNCIRQKISVHCSKVEYVLGWWCRFAVIWNWPSGENDVDLGISHQDQSLTEPVYPTFYLPTTTRTFHDHRTTLNPVSIIQPVSSQKWRPCYDTRTKPCQLDVAW